MVRKLQFALIFLGGTLLTSACKYVHRPPANTAATIKGHWVNSTLIQQIKDSGATPKTDLDWLYAEMIFDGKDSVSVDNGFETPYKLHYAHLQQNRYRIRYAAERKDLDIYFAVDSAKITITDSSGKNKVPLHFTQVNTDTSLKPAFPQAANAAIIAGNYIVYKNDKATTEKISFSADGTINGSQDFVGYALCYSGDCLEESADITQTTLLYLKSGPEKLLKGAPDTDIYIWKKDYKNKRLSIYQLAPSNPDIQGARKTMGKILELGW
ncbi:hypothetical protein [Taibaiella soli]|uniref:Lipoprotein n=1 Tax=Taibaiella soli TaxID=1649169 RepID=A0A2W2B1Y3_9BACT|nr:hypothetical protein [Taibaiella soli]PZF74274.1 hypothetical protein DN068_04505 [Taibaiella soli]